MNQWEQKTPNTPRSCLRGIRCWIPVVLMSVTAWLAAGVAHAQIPVTDAAAISQSATNQVQTIAHLAQQYQQLVQEVRLAESTLRSLNGFRDIGRTLLVSGAVRQALPANYAAFLQGMLRSGENAGSPEARALYAQVKTMPCSGWQGSGGSAAACQAPTMFNANLAASLGQATENAQTRASQLQGLALAADTSADTKASADLQSRIAAEQAQLLAEKTMLDASVRMQEAELQLAIAHQADLGAHIVTQAGRGCYVCP